MTTPTAIFESPTPAVGKIPAFSSIEEEAAFWDTHDFTELLDESAPADIEVAGELNERVERHARLPAEARAAKTG